MSDTSSDPSGDAAQMCMPARAVAPAPPVRRADPPSTLRTVVVLGVLVALGPLTIDTYLPALPAITSDLGATDAGVQMTLTGTLLGLAVGQLIVGPLSDALGRRRPLIAGAILHVLASLVCVIAPTLLMLGIARAAQGFGAAAAMVVALAVVRDRFDGNAAAVVLSRLMLVMGVAPIVAPSLGSVVLGHGSWRGIFVLLAALGVALILVAIFALPESLPPSRRRPADVSDVLRTYRDLLRDPIFAVLVVVAGLGMAALFSYIAGASFILQEQYGLDQQQFAIVFGLGAVALIGASQFNVVLIRRIGPAAIVGGALVVGVIGGAVLIVTTLTGFGGLWGFVVPVWVILAAGGFVIPNSPALALSRHGEAAGTAAALLGAAQFGLGALVAPLVGALGNDGPAMAYVMTATAAAALIALLSVRSRLEAPRLEGAAPA